MGKKLPVFELDINEEELNKSGAQFTALVDEPAVKMGWMIFSEQHPMKFSLDEDKRIVTGVALRSDFEIFRNDPEHGEHYVVFRAPQIEKIVRKWAKLGYHNQVNIMHDSKNVPDGVYVFESFIVDSKIGKSAPKGLECNDGSWIMSMGVENDQLWADIKSGKFTGFSMEGFFGYQFSEQKNPESEVFDLLNKQLAG